MAWVGENEKVLRIIDSACCDEAVAGAVESLWKKLFVADASIPHLTWLLVILWNLVEWHSAAWGRIVLVYFCTWCTLKIILIYIRIQSYLSLRDLLCHLLHTSTTYSIISMCKFNTSATLSLSTIPCHSTSCINIINLSLSSMPVHLRTSAPLPHFYNSYTRLFLLFSHPAICLSQLQKLQSHPSFKQNVFMYMHNSKACWNMDARALM